MVGPSCAKHAEIKISLAGDGGAIRAVPRVASSAAIPAVRGLSDLIEPCAERWWTVPPDSSPWRCGRTNISRGARRKGGGPFASANDAAGGGCSELAIARFVAESLRITAGYGQISKRCPISIWSCICSPTPARSLRPRCRVGRAVHRVRCQKAREAAACLSYRKRTPSSASRAASTSLSGDMRRTCNAAPRGRG